jgi:hypothetical protein
MLSFHVTILGIREGAPLSVSFDAGMAMLAELPRMFIEPDGSFVWTGTAADGQPWQVDGNLIDRGDVLAYVEVKGACPEKRLDELLRALGWPGSPLAFQLTRRGVTLDESAFRQLAKTSGAV